MVEDWDAAVADPRGCAVADAGYRVAGFISEWWPTSNRNAGRLRVGMGGRLPSESAGWIVQGVGGHEAGDAVETTGCDIESAGSFAVQTAPVAEPAEAPLDDPASPARRSPSDPWDWDCPGLVDTENAFA